MISNALASITVALTLTAGIPGPAADVVDATVDITVPETVKPPALDTPALTAKATYQASYDRVIALVDEKASADKLQAQVDKLLDYEWIAIQALGGPDDYATACGERCDEYKSKLTQLIRKNYLKRLQAKERGTTQLLGEEVRGTVAKVDTRVKFTRDGKRQRLDVSYVMHVVKRDWKARDILTEDVSLSKTYRHEFAKVIVDEGIDGLIAKLQAKLVEGKPAK